MYGWVVCVCVKTARWKTEGRVEIAKLKQTSKTGKTLKQVKSVERLRRTMLSAMPCYMVKLSKNVGEGNCGQRSFASDTVLIWVSELCVWLLLGVKYMNKPNIYVLRTSFPRLPLPYMLACKTERFLAQQTHFHLKYIPELTH